MTASPSSRVLRRWTIPTLLLLFAGACGDDGLGPDADRDPAGQPPAAPTGLQLTALGPTGVRLNWQDNAIRPFVMARRRVQPFRLCWLKTPGFAYSTHGEPDA